MNEHQHDDDPLTRALRTLAEDEESLGASAHVEARLLHEAAIIAGARRRRGYATMKAVAAVLLAAIAIATWYETTGRLPVAPAGHGTASTISAPAEDATEFFPLKYVNVPVTGGHTIRLELPQTALTTFGLEADDAAGTVLADVLVGQDGLARAVRFIRPPASVSANPSYGPSSVPSSIEEKP